MENKKLPGDLSVTVDGQTQILNEETRTVCFDVEDNTAKTVIVEFKSDDSMAIGSVKNPVLRVLAYLLAALFSTIAFFCDNEDGIHIYNCFFNVEAFELKKRFVLSAAEDCTVMLKYIPCVYNKETNLFSKPDIICGSEALTEVSAEVRYRPDFVKRNWMTYNVPAYCMFALILAFLNWVGFSVLAKVIMEIPSDSLTVSVMRIAGSSLCCAVILGLTAAIAVLFVKSYKLMKRVNGANIER